MFSSRTEYDRGVSTFSPEGRLFQVEYSLEAVKLGTTAIGISTSEGVVLGVEKKLTSPLLEHNSIEKIVEIDTHVGCTMSGLTADPRALIDHARVVSLNHTFYYHEKIQIESLTQSVCDLALRFGETGNLKKKLMSRPFGASLLIAGIDDDNGPQLYLSEPSGVFYKYDAKAIGSGSEEAQGVLRNKYHKSMTLREAELLILKILKQVMEENLDSKNSQLASVTVEKGFQIYDDERTQKIIDELENKSDL